MEKVEKVTVSVAIVLFDMKMLPIQSLRNSRGQGHLVTLAEGHF